MPLRGAMEQINEAVSNWEGVSLHPHRFGGTEYRLGKREIGLPKAFLLEDWPLGGHIHGDHLVDIPFPKKVRDEVVAAGQAQPHHVLPESGWVSFYLREPQDVERALALLRRSFELATKKFAVMP